MISVNRILYVTGRGGTLQVRLPSAKFPLRYSVGSQTSIPLSRMRNGISHRNITTRHNADARLTPKEFYEPDINQEIATRDLGGVEALTISYDT